MIKIVMKAENKNVVEAIEPRGRDRWRPHKERPDLWVWEFDNEEVLMSTIVFLTLRARAEVPKEPRAREHLWEAIAMAGIHLGMFYRGGSEIVASDDFALDLDNIPVSVLAASEWTRQGPGATDASVRAAIPKGAS